MTDAPALRALLAAPGTTLSKTLGAIQALEPQLAPERHITLGLSSNVSVDLLSTFLRKQGVLHDTRVEVQIGNHDDPVADAGRFADAGLQGMVLLPFFDNLLPAFELQIPHLSAEQIAAKEADLRARWRLAFGRARALPLLLVCTLHRYGDAVDSGAPDAVAEVLARLNAALAEEAAASAQVRLIDTEAIVRQLGSTACFDDRFYLRSTAPYTARFLDELALRIAQATRGFGSHYYKALVLDCDNTLWGGVVGEDLLAGIQLDPHSHPGKVYWRAQQAFLALERQGVLLCLCSKNNAADVDEVLDRHPHAVIRREHVAASRVNWQDKVSNLRSIAEELNIGLDSLVFVDDSAYECEAVRSALPMVRVVQVPAAITDYPRELQAVSRLFLAGGVSAESRSKTAQYRQRRAAAEAGAEFESHEAYLASLGLQVTLARDDRAQLARLSELTQKSNQFNLTTLRQTPAEIEQRMAGGQGAVFSLTVRDRFGDAGLTGIALLAWQGEVARVDAFLMSCRVIGRGVEFAVWPALAEAARRQGCTTLEACYRPTPKNAQVADFYDRLGLPLVDSVDGARQYRIALADFHPPTPDWIQVTR
jgi:FkbH-like protein